MKINLHEKSEILLKELANSLFDREPKNPKPVFFTAIEIEIVEDFLNELLEESKIGY
jgi:hypothetical protein